MKRILITLAVMAALAISAHAAEGQDDRRPLWGLRASFDLNIPGDWHTGNNSIDIFRTGYGLSIGGVCNIYLPRNFYFEPGLSFFYDTYSYDDLDTTDGSGQVISIDPRVSKAGLRMPLLLGYSFSIAGRLPMVVTTGPELNYAFSGKVKAKNSEYLEEQFPTDLFHSYGQRRFDCAWRVGVGFPLELFLVSVDASIGLTDLQKGDVSFREHRCSVNVTYYF